MLKSNVAPGRDRGRRLVKNGVRYYLAIRQVRPSGGVLRRLDLLAALAPENAHEPAPGVRLPPGGFHDLGQRCSLRYYNLTADVGRFRTSFLMQPRSRFKGSVTPGDRT